MPSNQTRIQTLSLAAGLALTACTNSTASMRDTAMPQHLSPPPSPPVVTSGELAPTGDPVKSKQMNFRPANWPLRFNRHNFDGRCYDTLECSIIYDGMQHGNPKPTQPSSAHGPDYLKNWNGNYSINQTFPGPAEVVWRSKDGAEHHAKIDFDEIFKDRIVLHHVPREELQELPDGEYDDPPSILLEVNDRIIRVYMSATVSTKHLQRSGRKLSNYRDDLILVRSYTF